MKAKVTTIALAALLLAAAAPTGIQAQGNAAKPDSSAAPAPGRVGILNVRLAVVSTAEGKQASAELQSQFAPRQTELENMRKRLQDIQTRLTTGGQTLADDERNRLTREGEALQKRYERSLAEFREDSEAAQAEVFDRIGRKLSPVVERYTNENGIVAVFDSSSAVIFHPTADITQDIIRMYDQANPVRAAAPATRPQTQPGQTKPPAATKPPQQ